MGDPWVPMGHAAFPLFVYIVVGSAAFLQLQGLLVRVYMSTARCVHPLFAKRIPSLAPGE